LNPASATVLVPPRPNLGPEPWPDATFPGPELIGLVLLIVCLAIGTVWILKRRGAIARLKAKRKHSAVALDDSPTTRFLALTGLTRDALAEHFGPGLRARTTEEIAVDTTLKEQIGEEYFDQLLCLLRAADRLKFAVEPAAQPEMIEPADLSTWEAWFQSFRAKATSRRQTEARGSAKLEARNS
jgi:hypothetical protein